jgi:hypothetical protein
MELEGLFTSLVTWFFDPDVAESRSDLARRIAAAQGDVGLAGLWEQTLLVVASGKRH